MLGPRRDWAGCMPWDGGPRDDAQAFVWYEKAARGGYAVAQRMLGKYYEKGIGTGKNPELARQWYKKAAAQGDEESVLALKRLEFPTADPVLVPVP